MTQIPLSWVFCLAGPASEAKADLARSHPRRSVLGPSTIAALGYDAAALVAARIRGGADNRPALRDALAAGGWYDGVSGTFRFDPLGNRLGRPPVAPQKKPGGLKTGGDADMLD